MSRILIAEDERRIASFLDKGLRANGFVTTIVADGGAALDHVDAFEYDLMVLDLGLPGRNGLEVLRSLRAHQRTVPVIVLTASGSLGDTIASLEGGADDYMTKPFRFEELLARIRLRLRSGEWVPEVTVLRHGELSLDLRTRRAATPGGVADLTAREYAMLELFLRHPGQVLSREQILSHVWGYDFDPGSNVVEVYVRTVRQKIGPARIATVRGMGYRLT